MTEHEDIIEEFDEIYTCLNNTLERKQMADIERLLEIRSREAELEREG